MIVWDFLFHNHKYFINETVFVLELALKQWSRLFLFFQAFFNTGPLGKEIQNKIL